MRSSVHLTINNVMLQRQLKKIGRSICAKRGKKSPKYIK